jgi:cytochrome c oxidase assembly factor CtaG
MAVLVIALGAAYLHGIRKVDRWPLARTLFFLVGGLGSIVLMTMWFFGDYDTTLFWPRAVQTVILLMVSPMFLALGMPVTLLMRTAKPETAARVARLGHSRFASIATFPAFISIALLTTPFAFFYTSWFDAALRGGWPNYLTHLWLVLVGWAYYWTRLQVDPVPKAFSPLVTIWITGVEVIFDGGLGLLLMFGHNIVGLEHYQAIRDWGPTPKADQMVGGASYWIIGDLSGLPFLGAVYRKWIKDDERSSAEIDRELDELEAAARVARSQRTDGPDAEPEPDDGMQAPWWETDPSRLRR